MTFDRKKKGRDGLNLLQFIAHLSPYYLGIANRFLLDISKIVIVFNF